MDIGKTIHPYSTLGESIGMAAEIVHGSCTDVPPARKWAYSIRANPQSPNPHRLGLFALGRFAMQRSLVATKMHFFKRLGERIVACRFERQVTKLLCERPCSTASHNLGARQWCLCLV